MEVIVDIKSLLEKRYVLLDGAMGTMLQRRGLKIGGLCEELNITNKQRTIWKCRRIKINT